MVSKTEKLLRKISKKDRQRLLTLMERLIAKDKKGLAINKIKGTDFFRLKASRFRIIFHEEKGNIIIDSIRLRNEKTYE